LAKEVEKEEPIYLTPNLSLKKVSRSHERSSCRRQSIRMLYRLYRFLFHYEFDLKSCEDQRAI